MSITLAHVINPVLVEPERDLHWQQPITFESMRIAKEFARDEVDVEQVACFYPEDEGMVPDGFIKADPLIRSTSGQFNIERKLPYFKDLFDRLYDVSDADYFVQTNADIILAPYFYSLVKSLIEEGNDSFCINKRILPEEMKDLPLPVLWSAIGGPHAGHDCFVFRRNLYPELKIGNILTGTPWSEATLITSLIAYAKNFRVFQHAAATFHIGDRRIWRPLAYNDYRITNTNEFARILRNISRKDKKILDHKFIQYMLGKLEVEVKGYKNETYSEDCWHFLK